MTYASAFAYASRSIAPDPYAPTLSQRKVRSRRRRFRLGLQPDAYR
jgi:hypothetical protein